MSSTDKHFDAHTIGVEGYLYLYPLVTMELTRRQMTNTEAGKFPGRGPTNTFSHIRAFPDADFRAVVRPNFDTLYSSAWIDLTDEPVVVSTPDTAGRYYLLPILDMWTDVVAAPGWRTTGTRPNAWLLAPTGWAGEIPEGTERITTSTSSVWMIGRIQTNGPADYPAVNALQDGLILTPLSNWISGTPVAEPTVTVNPDVDMHTEPLRQVNALTAIEYFTLAADLLTRYPPHVTDWSQLARIKRIGIIPGEPFEPARLGQATLAALETVPGAAMALMEHTAQTSARVANGWVMNTDTMGVYGNYYAKRAAVTLVGLGANQPEDAIYPLRVEPADGTRHHVIHMTAGGLPPVAGFWSLTMYDEVGFQVANPINRYAIGDRDPLQYNSDGSLDIWIQSENPGSERESNWLPAPTGPFSVLLRLYGPGADALNGRWNPPEILEHQ